MQKKVWLQTLFMSLPYNIQGNISVVKFSLHAVIVQWNHVV